MKTLSRIILLLAATVLGTPTVLHAQQRLLIRLTGDIMPAALRGMPAARVMPLSMTGSKALDQAQSSEERDLLRRLGRYVVIEVPEGIDPSVVASGEGVEMVRPLMRFKLHEGALTDDSLADRQYALHRIGASGAWKRATGKGIVVGIIDTGIDWTHEDLIDALDISAKEDRNGNQRFEPWPHTDTLGGIAGDLDGLDNDANGVVDDVIGVDVVNQSVRNLGDDRTFDPIPFDEQGHGTLVAGVIAATPNNRKGIAGLAYDARLRMVRAFDATGNGEEDNIASAIVYLAQQGVDVINMSFGDGADSPLMHDAVRYASLRGCVLVASVGNTGTISRQFPAGYDEVIAVAATGDENRRSPFSSSGALVALCAPGQAVVTTSVSSRYRAVNGTSFSAPYVAATVALMRERFADMPLSSVRATLQQRSLDLGPPGWDDLFGAGLVQADRVLEDGPWSRVEITSPRNESEIDPSKTSQLDVVGSTMLSSFAGYELAWGEGLAPRSWTTIGGGSTAVRDGLLGRVSIPPTDSAVLTLRLRVTSSDGRPLDVLRRLRVQPPVPLAWRSVEVVPVWLAERRTSVVTATLSQPCACELRDAPDSIGGILAQSLRRSRVHSMVVPDTVRSLSDRTLALRCTTQLGSILDTAITFAPNMRAAGADAHWRSLNPVSWTGYVLNDVRDLYGDGHPTVVMSDLWRGSFGGLVTRQYVEGRWQTRDSVPDVYIPRALGDANGNGLTDLLVHTVGKVVLLEQAVKDSSPFTRVVYADTSGELNAAGMADIDGDGREEILALSDDGLQVLTFTGSTFRLLGSVANPTPPAEGNASNRVDEISIGSGDFDGDGRLEIAFGDNDGDLVIAEWTGASFVVTHTLTSTGVGGSGFVAVGDVTGDGKPDVLFGVPDRTDPDANGDYGRSVWTYTALSSTGDNAFASFWQERVAGVRYGIGYRNGVAIGQLDDQPGQEIVICAFPRLYVFGRNALGADTVITCKRFINDAASPRFLIHDFDGNGRNELGYGVTVDEIGAMTSFSFTEALTTPRVAAPMSLKARWLRDSVVLDWFTASAGTECLVLQGLPTAPLRRMPGTFGARSVIAHTDLDGPVVRFAVRAVVQAPDILSESSNVVTVFRDDDTIRIIGDRDSVTSNECVTGVQLRVIASDDLDVSKLYRSQVVARDRSGMPLSARSIVARTLRDLVITLPALVAPDTLEVDLNGLRTVTGLDVPATTLRFRLTQDPSSVQEIVLSSIRVLSPLSLRATFSRSVTQTALRTESYRLTPAGSISAVNAVNDSTVDLILSTDQPLVARGTPYKITARDIVGTNGEVISTGIGSSLLFTVVAQDLGQVYAYPQPLRLNEHTTLTIAGLPASSSIEVLDAAFTPLATLVTTAAVGGIEWDLRLDNGRSLVPGLYYLRVVNTTSNSDAEPVLRKIWIQR